MLEHTLPEMTGRAGALCRRVLPGPVTLIVPNPGRRFAHLCGATPERIGVRVPVLAADVAGLADAVGGLALTSANLRGVRRDGWRTSRPSCAACAPLRSTAATSPGRHRAWST